MRSIARGPGTPGLDSRGIGRPSDTVLVAAITALAAGLRFATLDAQGFWFDESVTVGLLDRPLDDLLRELPDSESTPPLYYVLAWVWSKAFGLGETGLRSLSALCGTAAVPVAWAAARELCPRRAALAVAMLAAVNPFLVWYSQEARSYGLLTLLGGLSLWLLGRLLNRPTVRDLALWALVSALALGTHYFAIFLVAGEAFWLLWVTRGRRALAAVGAVAVAGAALGPLALSQEGGGYASFISEEALPRRVVTAVKQLALGFDSPIEPVSAGVAAAILLVGLGLALLRPDPANRRGVHVAITIAAAAAVLPLVMALAGKDYVLTRNLILVWLPMTIAAAAGLTSHAAGRAGTAGLAVAALLGLVSTVGVPLEPAWQREDWRGAAEGLRGPGPRAILVTEASHARPFRLYRKRAVPAPAGPLRVREVVAIARRKDQTDVFRERPDPEALARYGLRVDARHVAPTYELLRLEAANGAVVLSREQLRTLAFNARHTPTAVLLER